VQHISDMHSKLARRRLRIGKEKRRNCEWTSQKKRTSSSVVLHHLLQEFQWTVTHSAVTAVSSTLRISATQKRINSNLATMNWQNMLTSNHHKIQTFRTFGKTICHSSQKLFQVANRILWYQWCHRPASGISLAGCTLENRRAHLSSGTVNGLLLFHSILSQTVKLDHSGCL